MGKVEFRPVDSQLVSLLEADLKSFFDGEGDRGRFCRELEKGRILFFPETPFTMDPVDIQFLLAQKQVDARYHKNIAYRPRQNRVTGAAGHSPADRRRMLEVMGAFSRSVTGFLGRLLSPYAGQWRLDYASFRPRQEQGRKIKLKARNDLLHVDAFPTRPTHGDRILRFFTNINPEQPRHWITGERFEKVVAQEVESGMKLPKADESILAHAARRLSAAASSIGLPVANRSRYDEFMLAFHDYLKETERYQRDCVKYEWKFPPGSSWAVFTDSVPHAALSGQFALEQTFIISKKSMLLPELAPVNVLEKLCGFRLDR